jgi:peptidoglycan-associated lipoprotein
MMGQGHGRFMRKALILCGLVLALALAFTLAGCSKKAPVETDTTAGTISEPTEPVTPEQPADTTPDATPIPTPDYAAMDPAEYGIEDVFFAFDVYELTDEAMNTLAANARIMREHADLTWLVEGHCDERGTVEYNLALGEKRAKAVRDYLVSLGVPARQLRVTSYGEERPFAYGHDEQAWAQNRRAHFARGM